MKSFVNTLAWVVRRAPWAVIIITVVVALILGSLSGRFQPAEDQNESFAPDAPELTAAEAISDRFGVETNQSVMQFIVSSTDGDVITLDGSRVADTQTLGATAQVDRIEPLIQGLEAEKRKWETIHPSEPFVGQVIVQADRNIDFRVVKKVMFSAAAAGYGNVSFAVNQREIR